MSQCAVMQFNMLYKTLLTTTRVDGNETRVGSWKIYSVSNSDLVLIISIWKITVASQATSDIVGIYITFHKIYNSTVKCIFVFFSSIYNLII